MSDLTDDALQSRGRTGTTPEGWSKIHNDDVVAMRDELIRHRAAMKRLEEFALSLEYAHHPDMRTVGDMLRRRIRGDQ